MAEIQLTPSQIHAVDQFAATVNEALNRAITNLRDATQENPEHALFTIAAELADMCAEDEQCRDRIAIGYIYALYRLGKHKCQT